MRDYATLKAIVMQSKSLVLLKDEELIRVSEDPFAPIYPSQRFDWVDKFALPIIAELRDRLQRTQSQISNVANAVHLLKKIARASRAKDAKAINAAILEVCAFVDDQSQPNLFGKETDGSSKQTV